jgi:hypothetical protein
MHKVAIKGDMEKFYSKDLTDLKLENGENFKQSKIPYQGEYDAYGPDKKSYTEADWDAAYAELQAAGVKVTAEDIVKAVNNRAKAAARSKAMQAAADSHGLVKPTIETDVELQIANLVKSFVAKGMSADKARAKAIQILDTLDTE